MMFLIKRLMSYGVSLACSLSGIIFSHSSFCHVPSLKHKLLEKLEAGS